MIEAVCDAAPGMVVVDEAYAEFARDGTPSRARPCCRATRRLVVTRTMSKAFALAGARVGYLAADPAVVDALLLVRLPYHLSARHPGGGAGRAGATPPSCWPPSRPCAPNATGWSTGCAASGLAVADSDANFVLFGEFGDAARDLAGRCSTAGVLVREAGPPGWLRVTVGTPDEMTRSAARCCRAGRRPAEEARMSRSPGWSGSTKETAGPGRARPRRHRQVEVAHRRAVLRPHARPARQARPARPDGRRPRATSRSTRTTRSRTPRSPSAQALREALGDKAGISRFGDALVPLDETLAQAAVDLSGRPYLVHAEPDGMAPLIGTYDTTLTRHIFESLTASAGICLHVRVIAGRNPHHIVEAQFKAVARALRARARRRTRGLRGRAQHQGRAP